VNIKFILAVHRIPSSLRPKFLVKIAPFPVFQGREIRS
jgi:hypothetical protein